MLEADLLYEALKRPLGAVVRCDVQRLKAALSKLKKSDPALLELQVIGPSPNGEIFILRTLEAQQERGK